MLDWRWHGRGITYHNDLNTNSNFSIWTLTKSEISQPRVSHSFVDHNNMFNMLLAH